MSGTPFQRFLGRKDFIEVEMNHQDILLPGSGKVAIGTRNLNGCTAVAILGDALLLAHISPRPNPETSGEEHLDQMLRRLEGLYTKHSQHFPSHTTSWGFFGKLGGQPMKGVVETVQKQLSKRGLLVQPRFYEVAPASTKGIAAGELLVATRSTGTELYFERTLVEQKRMPTLSTMATTSASTSSSSTADQVHAHTSTVQMTKAAFANLVSKGTPPDMAVESLVNKQVENNPKAEKNQMRAYIIGLLNAEIAGATASGEHVDKLGVKMAQTNITDKQEQGRSENVELEGSDDDDEGDDDDSNEDDDENDEENPQQATASGSTIEQPNRIAESWRFDGRLRQYICSRGGKVVAMQAKPPLNKPFFNPATSKYTTYDGTTFKERQ